MSLNLTEIIKTKSNDSFKQRKTTFYLNPEQEHRLKLQIIQVVRKYLVAVSRKSYMKADDKEYTQSVYVEKACEDLGTDYLNMGSYDKHQLHEYCHQVILGEFRRLKTLPPEKIKERMRALGYVVS